MTQVLNLVATMLTDDRTENTWWLLTTFSLTWCRSFNPMKQIALNPTTYCKESLEYIERCYVGPVDDITKIYIPMYTEGHWYLMVVDMRNRHLIYLDPFKEEKLYDQRVGQMQFVALFLHTMLRGRRFYQKKNSIPAMIKDFKLTEPITGQQGEYS
ncbi:Ulp1 protease family, carboxy-terminal domain protein [Arachis hypogaea]|nr:Ulp1 protease family, carboxy-terminal domain protein [Arachis hypogaea]